MISKKDLKDYIDIFENSGLQVLELEDEEGMRILMEKPQSADEPQVVTIPAATPVTEKKEEVITTAPSVDNSKVITSPMFGVFYSAASPESNPFVSVGKRVNKGDVVCIVEAMKIMNEITAEENGIITEILVNNGDVVEYGQPLFKLQ